MPFIKNTYKVMGSPKKSEHYVNNKDFLAALIEYRSDVELTFFKYWSNCCFTVL